MYSQPKIQRNTTQPCNWSIDQLPGLSPQDQTKLKEFGITTTGQLLQSASTGQLRQALANQLHIKTQSVNKWVALADLARLPGIGCQYCGLVLACRCLFRASTGSDSYPPIASTNLTSASDHDAAQRPLSSCRPSSILD
jgi:hypothetical protein